MISGDIMATYARHPLRNKLPFHNAPNIENTFMYLLTGTNGETDIFNWPDYWDKDQQHHDGILGQTRWGKTKLLQLIMLGHNVYLNSTIIHRETEKRDMLLLAPGMAKGYFYAWLPEGVEIEGNMVEEHQIKRFSMLEPRRLAHNIINQGKGAINTILHDYFAANIKGASYDQIGWFWYEFFSELFKIQQELPFHKLEHQRIDIFVDEANKLFPASGKGQGSEQIKQLKKLAVLLIELSGGLNLFWHLASHSYQQIEKDIRKELSYLFIKHLQHKEAEPVVEERVPKRKGIQESLKRKIATLKKDEYLAIDADLNYDYFKNSMLTFEKEGKEKRWFNFRVTDKFDKRSMVHRLLDEIIEKEAIFECSAPKTVAKGYLRELQQQRNIPEYSQTEFERAYNMAFARHKLEQNRLEKQEMRKQLKKQQELISELKSNAVVLDKHNVKLTKRIKHKEKIIEKLTEKLVAWTRNETIYWLYTLKLWTREQIAEYFGRTPQRISQIALEVQEEMDKDTSNESKEAVEILQKFVEDNKVNTMS